MPQAMKLAILASAAALYVLLGVAVSPAEAETGDLSDRLRSNISSLGKQVEMPLVAFTGTYEVRRRGERPRPPRQPPRIDVATDVPFGITVVPRAARVRAMLLDVRKRRTRIIEQRPMDLASESGRRWRTAFGRTRGGDLLFFDVTYPRNRRPHYKRGRVSIATFLARTSERER